MQYIRVKGSYYEVGNQIGKYFANKINVYVEQRYIQMSSELKMVGCDFDKKDYLEDAQVIVDYIKQFAENEYDELHGIADSSCQKIEDIVFAIGYTDIFDMILSKKINRDDVKKGEINGECSTFVAKNGKYCGQNWDMDQVSKDSACMMIKEYIDGTKICAITTILGLVHMGMNSYGICTGIANLSTRNTTKNGMIFPIIQQKLLRAKNQEEILNVLKSFKYLSGHYYYVGVPNGKTILFETDGLGYKLLSMDNNFFAHTNHYLDSELKKSAIDYSRNSYVRYNFLNTSLASQECCDLKFLQNILADHERGMCRHEKDIVTAVSIIFAPKDKVFYLCDDFPCKGAWIQYNMEEIFKTGG